MEITITISKNYGHVICASQVVSNLYRPANMSFRYVVATGVAACFLSWLHGLRTTILRPGAKVPYVRQLLKTFQSLAEPS
jgi:hypothetical protein